MLICCISVLAVFGCQHKAEAPAAPAAIEARDASGTVVATLRPGHPCRATIGPIEMIVGGPPLVAQVGETKWTGEHADITTKLFRDGVRIGDTRTGDDGFTVMDTAHGQLVLKLAADTATALDNRKFQPIRTYTRKGAAIVTDGLTITGTDDLALAAALTAPELRPEVRMLAACERVL